MVHLENRTGWNSASGIPWPSKDEFEIGGTLEHAGYYVTWLAAMFGPATSVTAFASAQLPDKGVSDLSPPDAPDFSVGCIQFASGVAARLTCSIIAAHYYSLRLFGDKGTLVVKEAWDFGSPVLLKKWTPWTFRAERRSPALAHVAVGPPDIPLSARRAFARRARARTRLTSAAASPSWRTPFARAVAAASRPTSPCTSPRSP